MTAYFSPRYVADTLYLFSRYPAAFVRLTRGSDEAAGYIDRARIRDYSRNPVKVKRAFGFDILLNPADKVGVSPSIGATGLYEPHVTELYRRLIKRGMTVVDVGANVGWYTLLAAERGCRVFSFEPDPASFGFLLSSIELNRFSDVTPIRKCVTDSIGVERLYLASENLGGHSIVSRVGDDSIDVASTRLDVELGGVDHIGVLKIDAEGAEPEVLLGAGDLLPRAESVVMEWNPVAWEGHSGLLEEVFRLFMVYEIVRSPFLLKRIGSGGLARVPAANLFLRRRAPRPV